MWEEGVPPGRTSVLTRDSERRCSCRPDSLRPVPRRRIPDASHGRMWEEGVPPGRTRSSPAPLANFFPGRGRGALERVGLGLLLVADLLVEAARDHLVGHRLGDAELGERFHLVRHHLAASTSSIEAVFLTMRRAILPGRFRPGLRLVRYLSRLFLSSRSGWGFGWRLSIPPTRSATWSCWAIRTTARPCSRRPCCSPQGRL